MQHIWTVLCRRCLVDNRSNVASLIEVVEQISLKPGPEMTEGGEGGIAPLSSELVTLWGRSELAQPEHGQVRTRFLRPDGTQVGDTTEYDVDLTSHPRGRHIIGILALPIQEAGRHVFAIDLHRDGEWVEAARIPLQVLIDTPEQSIAV